MTLEDRDSPSDERESRSSAFRPRRRQLSALQETGVLLVIALLLAIAIKALLVQAFYIPSESMEPGLIKNDRILVEKPSYWFGKSPQRGDVVVFKDPGGWLSAEDAPQASNPITQLLTKVGLYPSGGHLVKRVIGVPGDVIECCDARGRISVNGVYLDESTYARPADESCEQSGAGTCYGPMPRVGHWKAGPVPAGMLFVMGDNRNHSADSSYHLCTEAETDCSDLPWVPESDVVGKVMAVVWPFSRAKFEHRPADFASIDK
ncbi:signal peptidase I [Nocardioides sp.]|uniref:signal peptidase I n=1 Tax=Nocardioides sp. TaxID=35761 RepID=UPI00261AF4D8|nr:signal peptidase I [Nocardioides sp.]